MYVSDGPFASPSSMIMLHFLLFLFCSQKSEVFSFLNKDYGYFRHFTIALRAKSFRRATFFHFFYVCSSVLT